MLKSKNIIEHKIAKKVIALSLPGGRSGKMSAKIAGKIGYKCIFNSRPGINRCCSEKRLVFRIPIHEGISIAKFKKIANLHKSTYKKEYTKYLLKNILKVFIGSERYHEIWRRYS